METYIDFDEPYTSDVFDDVDPLLEVEELPKEIRNELFKEIEEYMERYNIEDINSIIGTAVMN